VLHYRGINNWHSSISSPFQHTKLFPAVSLSNLESSRLVTITYGKQTKKVCLLNCDGHLIELQYISEELEQRCTLFMGDLDIKAPNK
jgi:hypothetical protein